MSEFRLVEKKSVFVGILMPLDLEEDFRVAFLEVKEKHPAKIRFSRLLGEGT